MLYTTSFTKLRPKLPKLIEIKRQVRSTATSIICRHVDIVVIHKLESASSTAIAYNCITCQTADALDPPQLPVLAARQSTHCPPGSQTQQHYLQQQHQKHLLSCDDAIAV